MEYLNESLLSSDIYGLNSNFGILKDFIAGKEGPPYEGLPMTTIPFLLKLNEEEEFRTDDDTAA